MTEEYEQKLDEMTKRLEIQQKESNDQANFAEMKIIELENDLKTVHENMKQLEITAKQKEKDLMENENKKPTTIHMINELVDAISEMKAFEITDIKLQVSNSYLKETSTMTVINEFIENIFKIKVSEKPDFKSQVSNLLKDNKVKLNIAIKAVTAFAPKSPSTSGFSPPPTPPPLPNEVVMLKKPKIKPKNPMKPLYWSRIRIPVNNDTATSNKDLWEGLEETPIDVDELDKLFSRKIIQSTLKKHFVDQQTTPKIKTARLLDTKRSQHVGILIKSKKLNIQKLEKLIYNLDDVKIDFEMLEQVRKIQATPDEIQMIRDHIENAGNIPLDNPEQFLWDLSKISNFNERLDCFNFQRKFSKNLNKIKNRLNNINHVCDVLLNSDSMKKLFG